MTTITLDDQLIKQIITVSHDQNAQEAVIKILADYVRQQKIQMNLIELLAMPDVAEIGFEPPHLTNFCYPTDLT
jgi:hypothetical protein